MVDAAITVSTDLLVKKNKINNNNNNNDEMEGKKKKKVKLDRKTEKRKKRGKREQKLLQYMKNVSPSFPSRLPKSSPHS